MAAADEMGTEERKPFFRDIRRYYCEYCGICRSKKALITAHILSNHKDKHEKDKEEVENTMSTVKKYACPHCDAVFKKPAYLKQHMQGHSIERPYACPVDDCPVNYRRKDHLSRHLLSHLGKLFTCPIEGCKREFAFQGNMTRHLNELHDEDNTSDNENEKLYTCSEIGCGKSFKYPSKLRRHQESHVKLDTIEVICCEPGCMKSFSNKECLKAHVRSCHQYIKCPDCGTQQLKKNFKRHQRTHEQETAAELFSCTFDGCLHKFSTKSNLNKHVESVHLQKRPFSCRISGCGMKFSFKHVRDNHEKSGIHAYVPGDFLEADERFRSRPRGGRKRTFPDVETLFRKRIAAPVDASILDNSSDYLRWLLDEDTQ